MPSLVAPKPMIRAVRQLGWVFGAVPGWYMIFVEPWARRSTGVRTVAVAGGAHLQLALEDFVQRKAYFRAYERRELRFIRRFVRPGDLVVDAGANVGVLTVAFAAACGARGRVVAIEPVPENLAALRRNAGLNPTLSIETHPVAVGAAPARLRLDIRAHQHAIGNFGSYSAGIADGAAGIEVDVATIDDLLLPTLEPGGRVRLLKIDVEGMEADVVRGAAALLSAHRIDAVMAEWNASVADESVASALTALGYDVRVLGALGRARPVRPPRARRAVPRRLAHRSGLLGSVIGWVIGTQRLSTLVAFAPTPAD